MTVATTSATTSATPTLRLVVVYHKGAGRHWYSIARRLDLDGEVFAAALPQGQYQWQDWQFSNRAKAFKTARAAGDVHDELMVQDYTRRHVFAVKPLEAT